MNSADKVSQLAEVAREIRADPLARIMYGSRELFHSNLLAWLCDEFPEKIGPVLDQLIEEEEAAPRHLESMRVQREWRHLDLVLSWTNRPPLVIENKVFSLPRQDQLDNYAQKIREVKALGPETRAILLSLGDPGWRQYTSAGEPDINWHFVSYGDLAGRLAEQLPSDWSYELETARRYIQLAQRLQKLADLLRIDDESEPAFISGWAAEADDKQLMTAVSKLRALNVSNYIEKKVPSSRNSHSASAGLTNATPIVEFMYPMSSGDVDVQVGWQVQGQQFRLFAVLPHLEGRTEENRAARNKWGTENRQYFNFENFGEIVGSSVSDAIPADDKFNRYDPDFIGSS